MSLSRIILTADCAVDLLQLEAAPIAAYAAVEPVDVLQHAYERALSDANDEGFIGSSTALIAILRNDELRIANMGDCCCSVIRGREYIFRSEEQQHAFNYPVQVGTHSQDVPERDAQRFTIKVQKDDIVVLCSDGLVDNLFDEDVLEEILRHARDEHMATGATTPPGASSLALHECSPQRVSELLCERAKMVSEDEMAVASPFAQKAMEEGLYYTGGKRDDISVLVAFVGDHVVRLAYHDPLTAGHTSLGC